MQRTSQLVPNADLPATWRSHSLGGYWIATVVVVVLLSGWLRRRRRVRRR